MLKINKLIILFLLLSLLLIVNKYSQKVENFLNNNIYENIDDFLKDNKDNNVVFCVANHAIKEMVDNLIISANKNNVKLVLFALDNDIIKYIRHKCIIVKYFNSKVKSNLFYEYGSEEFKDIVFFRFIIGNTILKSNKSYIYLDTDIVINKNFEKYILDKLNNINNDCLIQFNGTDGCTGFFAMKPTIKTLTVNIKMLKKYDYKKYEHDQDFFNKVILKNKLLNVKYLSRELFPNGKYYYNNHRNIEKKCHIIHFNCIVGYDNKINKMKKYKKWYL